MSKAPAPRFIAAIVLTALAPLAASAQGVQVVAHESERRVDITIDGRPFTSLIWPTSLKKPVLYPLITDDGVTLTRGYPLDPLPGERVDHLHHAGLWFNYGNANGFDFWNNSDAIKPESRAMMGTIAFKKVLSTKSGPETGELVIESTWITGTDVPILDQITRYTFARGSRSRVVDCGVELRALDRVVFKDDKEGLLGLRVARWLESPDEKGGVFRDANGKPTKVSASDSKDATGIYVTSEGARGPAVWSTRGRWCSLSGHSGSHESTIAIFDNPGNPGYPTYWHARGYGLFAANPLGRNIFDPQKPAFNFTIEKGQTANFRYRVVLYSYAANADELNREADRFAGAIK